MSLDLSFHDITTLKADAKIERRSQYVDLQIIPATGAPTEITIHFDSKAKAKRFATAINYAAKCEAQAAAFGGMYDIEGASKAVEEHAARIIQSMRDNPKPPPAPRPHRMHTVLIDGQPLLGAGHTDAFADTNDSYQREVDDERQCGWAYE